MQQYSERKRRHTLGRQRQQAILPLRRRMEQRFLTRALQSDQLRYHLRQMG